MKILNRGKDSKDTESFNKIKVNDEPSLKLLNSILNEESNLGNRSISENSTIFRLKSDDVKLIAFYLPQFHQIPENDKWWGEGFTEWTNVKKAIPQFKGHYQPHIPGELGYYNLTNKEVMKRQIELAKQYGIYGFCFHHYWFAGKRLLEKPVNMLIENKDLDIPFCLCWANENWTRRWDGLDNEVLIAQKHSPEDDINFIEDISKYFNDTRYIKIDEKPVLIVYRIELFPNPEDTIVRWRKWMEDHGYKGIYLIGAQGFACKNPTKYGLDAAVEFPPNGMYKYNYISSQVSFKNPNFKGNIVDYSYYVNNKLYLKEDKEKYNLFKTIIPSWDNTPRRGNKSTIFYNSSPELYKQWLKDIIIYTKTKKNKDEQFVFINAWNEWGEGAYLEPDVKYGYSYLNSTKEAILETRKLNKKILYVSHDTKYGGAQLLSLNIIKYLKEKFKYDISIIAINCGWFEDEFKKYGDFYNVDNNLEKAHSIIKKLRNSGVDIAICNTVISGDLVKLLKNENYKVITLIHELSGTIKAYNAEEKARNISIYSDTIIFPSKYVKDEFKDIVDKNIENKSKIIPQGVFNNKREYKDKKICTKDLKEKGTHFLLLTGSTLLMAVGTYFFKFTNNFTFGGITGLAVLIAKTGVMSAGDFNLIASMILLLIGMISALCIFCTKYMDQPWIMLPGMVLSAGIVYPFSQLMDAWVNISREKQPDLIYSRVRAGGSIGYAVMSVIGGYYFKHRGWDGYFLVQMVIFLFMIPFLLLLPDTSLGNRRKREEKEKSLSFFQAFRTLVQNRRFLFWLGIITFYWFSHRLVGSFLSLIIVELGGDAETYGNVCGAGAAVEFAGLMLLAFAWKKKNSHALLGMAIALITNLLRPFCFLLFSVSCIPFFIVCCSSS